MAGCVFLCSFMTIFVVIYLIFGIGETLFGSIKGTFYWGLWIMLYGIAACVFFSIFAFMYRYTYQLGVEIATIKEHNKLLNSADQLQFNLGKIMTIIILNLVFLTFLGALANYFQVWYIKFTLVGYVCFVLGYTASYPLCEKDRQLLLIDKSQVSKIIDLKTMANTTVFFSMYLGYYFYF